VAGTSGRAGRGSNKERSSSAAAVAVKSDTRMQPRLHTVAEKTGLFNLHRMMVINLHCIPTLVVEISQN